MKRIYALFIGVLMAMSTAVAQTAATSQEDTLSKNQDKRLEVTTKDKAAVDSLRRYLTDDSAAIRFRQNVNKSLMRQLEKQRANDLAVGDTPEATVTAYFRRLNDGDFAGAQALTTEDSTIRGTILFEKQPATPRTKYTILKTETDGLIANVTVLCESSSTSVLPVTIVVRCEWVQAEARGEWRITTTRPLERQ